MGKGDISACGFRDTGRVASDGFTYDEAGPGRGGRWRDPYTGRTFRGLASGDPVCICDGFTEHLRTVSSSLDRNQYGTCRDPKGFSATTYHGGLQHMTKPKYIIHPKKFPADPDPIRDEDGAIMGDGAIGRVTEDNAYLSMYADYPDDRRPRDLEIGERIQDVRFRLSGQSGNYDVWRVS